MKRIIFILLAAAVLVCPAMAMETLSGDDISISAPSAVLMEKETGTLLYEKNAHEHLAPASVTKVMTLLLIVEELESGNLALDTLITCSAYAAGMGGSQIWLEEGEQMTVDEMLKCITVVSANDCSVALAEHIAGSEETFVSKMNLRAKELGMTDTNFTNCTGLFESDLHYTCAYDIALMSRELLSYDLIKTYTQIWMDSVRDGKFGLSNTNKLIYYYEGATGLKTGFTAKAMYCLSASAERDGVEYIAVVMNAPSSNDRFESAKTLLNYGFANYRLVSLKSPDAIAPVRVELGKADAVQPVYQGQTRVLVSKEQAAGVEYILELEESVKAPVAEGQQLGTVTVKSGETILGSVTLGASNDVERKGMWDIFETLFSVFFGKNM